MAFDNDSATRTSCAATNDAAPMPLVEIGPDTDAGVMVRHTLTETIAVRLVNKAGRVIEVVVPPGAAQHVPIPEGF